MDDMTDTSRDQLRLRVLSAIGVLLLASLAMFVWYILRAGPPQQRQSVAMIRLLPPPPPLPPKPQPVAQKHVDRVRMVTKLKPKPRIPRPKTRAVVMAKPVVRPLTLDEPPSLNPLDIPQGANEGVTLGGGGDDGGCGGGAFYETMLRSQVAALVMRDEQMEDQTFRVQADVWFDDTGGVKRVRLSGTTGSSAVDGELRGLIGKVDLGTAVPQCIPYITVWVSDPVDGSLQSHGKVETWLTGSRRTTRGY